MRNKKVIAGKMLALDAVIAFVLLSLDQFTKYLAISHLKGQPAIVLIDDVLELSYVENRGVAFSLFQNRNTWFIVLGFIILALLLYVITRIPADRKYRIAHILMAVLIAGALGNLIDRLRHGFVVDFISFVLIHFPVFNVADCYLVVCTVSICVLFMFVYQEEDLAFLSFKEKQIAEPEQKSGSDVNE